MHSEQRTLSMTAFLAEGGVMPGLQVLASPSVAQQVRRRLDIPMLNELSDCRLDGQWLLVVGGGRLIDQVKLWRHDNRVALKLAAAASIWGSGAEASPIAVDSGLPKRIEMGEGLRPDIRVQWPELADQLPESLARWACGDVWSHALEGLLSPLARGEVEAELAATVKALMSLPVGRDPAWFEISARASTLQARASVGLIHGIAHVLEPRLAALGQPALAAHARLCSSLLWPVFRFNLRQSPKAADRLLRHGILSAEVERRLKDLHNVADFAAMVPAIRHHWELIVRDPCSRTNVALVRKDALELLLEGTPA